MPAAKQGGRVKVPAKGPTRALTRPSPTQPTPPRTRKRTAEELGAIEQRLLAARAEAEQLLEAREKARAQERARMAAEEEVQGEANLMSIARAFADRNNRLLELLFNDEPTDSFDFASAVPDNKTRRARGRKAGADGLEGCLRVLARLQKNLTNLLLGKLIGTCPSSVHQSMCIEIPRMAAALKPLFIPQTFDADASKAVFANNPEVIGGVVFLFVPNSTGMYCGNETMEAATYSATHGRCGWKVPIAITPFRRAIPLQPVPGCRNCARALLEDRWLAANTPVIVSGVDGLRQDRHRVYLENLHCPMPNWHRNYIIKTDGDDADKQALADWNATVTPVVDLLLKKFWFFEGNRMPPCYLPSVMTIMCAYVNWLQDRERGGPVPSVRRQVPVSIDPGDADVRALPDVTLPRDWLCGLTCTSVDEWLMNATIPQTVQHDMT
jgi:hypothetical protein